MQYYLMHKNITVASLDILESGDLRQVTDVFNYEHLPIGSTVNNEFLISKLSDWWKGRSIPATRQGLDSVLQGLNLWNSQQLIDKCLGLSLSDHYWIKPMGSTLCWEDINFFMNNFSEDMGELLFGSKYVKSMSLCSPDNTSDGWLKKKWKIIDGQRYLIKGGSQPYYQEPVNEVIASELMQRLDIAHVPYELMYINNFGCSICPNFLDTDTELVTMHSFAYSYSVSSNVSAYQHVVNCCLDIGLTQVTDFINQLIVVDFLMANEDRHLGNFGLVRDANTLEWLGFAPIYDTGTSLYHRASERFIPNINFVRCKPWSDNHITQLNLITDLSWFNTEALTGFTDFVFQQLCQLPLSTQYRNFEIAQSIQDRINYLQSL